MMQNIVMPKLGETMEEGTILRWLVKKGDIIAKGDAIMEIQTDKAALDVESLVAGRISEICVTEGQTVPIGTIVAHVSNDLH